MRLLFVCENYLPHYGGAEVVFKNLAEGFVKAGHTVDLVTHRMQGTAEFEVLNGVRVHRVWSANSRYLFSFTSILKVWSLARRADIIQTTTFNGAPPAWIAARFCGKKVVLTVHEVWVGKWKVVTGLGSVSCFFHDLLERMIYVLHYDKYVCVSDATKRDVLRLGIPARKVERIYNGFDYDHWQAQTFSGVKVRSDLGLRGKFVYFSWGRPGPSKGFEYALRAVPEIVRRIPNSVYMIMLGSKEKYPKEYAKIVSLIKKLGIQKNVIIVPSVPYSQLGNYIAAADCVVVPSLSEGFGYTAVEAGVMAKPVVASNVASLPEVVSGKYVLVRVRDSSAIAAGVEMVYKKKYATSPLKRFLWKDAVEGYLDIYRKLTNLKR